MKYLITAIILLAIMLTYIFYLRQAVVEHNQFEGVLIPLEVVENEVEQKWLNLGGEWEFELTPTSTHTYTLDLDVMEFQGLNKKHNVLILEKNDKTVVFTHQDLIDLFETSTPVTASYYDYTLDECNGCTWSKNHLTAASRTLPRYSTVRVTRVDTGEYVDVYINDWVENQNVEIDLSSFAFSQLANLSLGLIEVTVEPL